MQPVATSEPKIGVAKRVWQRLRRGRIYYWPIRTLVQLGFFLLFAGLAIARLNPSFDGARSWVVLPVVASVKAQGGIGSTLDATTLLLSQAVFPWLPIGIMFVVGAVLGRFMCGWICPVGFLQDVITGIKGRVDSVQTRTHEYWIRLKYVLVGITFLISGTLGLALYYGVGSDYKQSLGSDLASGLFIAITPDGTLFGTLPVLLAHSWRFLGTAQASDLSAANLGSWLGSISTRHGVSPDSGADTSARSEASWQSSRRTAYSECTGILSNARTARNARLHVLCRFQYWTWIGKSSTTRNASFAWHA